MGPINIIEYDTKYAEDTAKMRRDSMEKAIKQKPIHPFEEDVYFLNHILSKEHKIYIAVEENNNKVVGMIAFNETEISQLYIHNDYQGIGLGKKFLQIAKNNSKGYLTLYTFEVNKKAQAFYQNHGFKIIARGHENEENLADIKYEWRYDNGK